MLTPNDSIDLLFAILFTRIFLLVFLRSFTASIFADVLLFCTVSVEIYCRKSFCRCKSLRIFSAAIASFTSVLLTFHWLAWPAVVVVTASIVKFF